MNYPYKIPGGQTNPNAFVADNTLTLGYVDKPVGAKTMVSVDYSQVIPALTLQSYSFRVRPGGEPQIAISESEIGGTQNTLSFMVGGGIAGRAYDITINTVLGTNEVRSDVLTINVLGDSCPLCPPVGPPPVNPDLTSGDGSLYVNLAPRFFVSATEPVAANVLDRWYNTTTGDVYDYITNGNNSFWQLSGGGGGGGSGANIYKMTPIIPDGSTTVFNLTTIGGVIVNIVGSNTLFVSVDGVWQEPGAQYNAVNNQITFTQAPTADAAIFMLWFAPATAT